MLRQSQLKKPLTVIVVLTGIAFLLEGGALGYQVISGFIGINKTQVIYTVCSSSVNTILSNSNIFFIVALACSAVALITLALMFILILMGMCKWNSSESKYVESGPQNNEQNMATQGNKGNNQATGDIEDQYFTSGKFLLGTIVYLVGLVGTLGHFSMMLTIAIGFTACSGSMLISLLVISVLGIIAFVLALVSFIKWQIQSRKLNQNNQQNHNQEGNQNQSLSQGNQNVSNQQTRQNLVNNKNQNMETIEPFRTQQDEQRRPANNKAKNNFLAPDNNTKNPQAEYMSFNGKNTPGQNENPQQNKSSKDPKSKTAVSPNNYRESAQPRQTNNKNQQEPTKSKNTPQQGSTHANPPKPKNNSQQQQSYSQAKPKNNSNNQQLPGNQNKKALTDSKNSNNNNNLTENPKGLKTSERMSLESSKGGSKHPTPKFVLSQDEDNQDQSNSREASNILRQSNSKKDNQQKNSQKKQNQANQAKLAKNKEPQKANEHYEDDNEQKIQNEEDFKESKKEIMKNNGGRPFFKSPPKPKETLPSYYRSPLEKYERQDEDNVRSRQKSQSNKNYPQSNPQSNPQESNLKSSISQKKLVEEQKKFLDQSNASSDKSRGQPQRQGRLNLHRNTGMEMKNEQRRQADQKSMKKSKKTGMLLDYIRSKYAD